jgi:hypothetical protein
MHLRRTLVIALSLSAAACVAPKPMPTPAPPARTPTPAPAPPPAAVSTSWMDAPQTPGDWRYAPVGGGSAARFGDTAGEPRFTLRCTIASRSVELLRSGPFAGNAPMTVRSESATRALAGTPAAGQAGLRAVLSASDPLLDAMAFSKGRFAVETPGAPTLYLPSWPEVTRVIEDCR